MAARSKARKRALEILYEADVRGEPATDLAPLRMVDRPLSEEDYVLRIVEGVTVHRDAIDEVLRATALGWDPGRMSVVDRTLLRIGTWEILWGDVPPVVAVDEAVTLASEFSGDESPGFVNGVLDAVLRRRPEARAELGTD